jgi:enoyl-CoA hydratase/carnithine racemase
VNPPPGDQSGGGLQGADDLFQVTFAKAEEIANNPTQAVIMVKELLTKNPLDPDLGAVIERELLRDQIARRLPGHTEAVATFREKRQPAFNR